MTKLESRLSCLLSRNRPHLQSEMRPLPTNSKTFNYFKPRSESNEEPFPDADTALSLSGRIMKPGVMARI